MIQTYIASLFLGVQCVKTEKSQYGSIRSVYVRRKKTVGCHPCVSLDVEGHNVTSLIVALAKVFLIRFFDTYLQRKYPTAARSLKYFREMY